MTSIGSCATTTFRGWIRRREAVVYKNILFLIGVCLCSSVAACKREQRQFTAPPSTFESYTVTMSDIHPGSAGLPLPMNPAADQRAYDTNEGKRLFTQYNCAGCHFNGGGGIGPALMDAQWIYG